MLGEIDRQLQQTKEELKTAYQTERDLQQAKLQLEQQQNERKKWAEQARKAKGAVRRLSRISLRTILYWILGIGEEKRRQAEQKLLEAQNQYGNVSEATKRTETRVIRLKSQWTPIASLEEKYSHLLSQKEQVIVDRQGEQAKQLSQLTTKINQLRLDGRELKEAIAAGQRAVSALHQVQSDLDSAKGWGTWDILGGGIISTAIKHSRLDAAKQHTQAAQQRIAEFKAELADVGQHLSSALEVGGFLTIADYIFDGMIADFMMQSKINKSMAACKTALNEVLAVQTKCQDRLSQQDALYHRLVQQKQAFVEGA